MKINELGRRIKKKNCTNDPQVGFPEVVQTEKSIMYYSDEFICLLSFLEHV